MAYFIDGVEYTETEYKEKLIEVQAHVALINSYVQKINDGVITIDDVPEEYYDEVYAIINAPEPEPYDPNQEFVDKLVSEVNS